MDKLYPILRFFDDDLLSYDSLPVLLCKRYVGVM